MTVKVRITRMNKDKYKPLTYNPLKDRSETDDKLGAAINYLANKNTARDSFYIFKVNGKYTASEINAHYNKVYKPLGIIGGKGIVYKRNELKRLLLEVIKNANSTIENTLNTEKEKTTRKKVKDNGKSKNI